MICHFRKLVNPLITLAILSNTLLGCSSSLSKQELPNSTNILTSPQSKSTFTDNIVTLPMKVEKEPLLAVGDLSELSNDKSCVGMGDILIYAETKNYVAYICGNKQHLIQPAYFIAKPKIDRKKPSIVGKVVLGWKQIFFVGENKEYTYLMDVFPVNFLLNDKKPYLVISPFSIVKKDINRYREELTKYLSIEEFRQAKTIGLYWIKQNSESSLKSKKSEFIKYLTDNRERLKVCEIPVRDNSEITSREDYSSLYKFNESTFILQLRCNVYLKYNSYNFFLIEEQNGKFKIKFLTQPKILKDRFANIGVFKDRLIYGQPLYDPRTKVLRLNIPFSGPYLSGELLTFSIVNEEFKLVEFRYSGDNDNLYLDPVLYPRLYP